MAETLFDLRVVVAAPRRKRTVSQENKSQLFRTPDVKTSREKEAGSAPRAERVEPEERPEIPGSNLSTQELYDGYSELKDYANSILEKLKQKAKGMDMPVDPETQPTLWEAVASIFKGGQNKITSEMYFAAVELDREIARELGEMMHGTNN